MSGSCARDRLIHHAMSGSHAAPRVISSKRRRSESTEEACRGGYPPWIVRGQGEQVAAELVVGAILAGPTQACPRNVLRDPDHPATCARCAFCDRDHPKPCGRWFFVIPITPNRAPDGFCDPERVPAVPPQRFCDPEAFFAIPSASSTRVGKGPPQADLRWAQGNSIKYRRMAGGAPGVRGPRRAGPGGGVAGAAGWPSGTARSCGASSTDWRFPHGSSHDRAHRLPPDRPAPAPRRSHRCCWRP